MKINERFKYIDLNAETLPNGKRHYVAPNGDRLPSVTTILSATKDMTVLDAWRKRIGDEEADKQIRDAINVGNLLHENLERHLLDLPPKLGGNLIHKMARQMTESVINRGLTHVTELWGVEIALYYPGMYAGRSDVIGMYDGEPAIMDFKNSKKIKKREWIEDYFMQLCAYAMAHNEVYGTDIRTGVIFMASRDMKFEKFIINGDEFDHYTNMWIETLEKYFETQEK